MVQAIHLAWQMAHLEKLHHVKVSSIIPVSSYCDLDSFMGVGTDIFFLFYLEKKKLI